MGIFNLFRKKDPIEKQWEQERKVKFKSTLQEARMKEAEIAARQQAEMERKEKLKPKANFVQRTYAGFSRGMSEMNNIFGSPQRTQPVKKKKKRRKISRRDAFTPIGYRAPQVRDFF